MIKYIYANNYKSFVNFRVDFKQICLLIGKNGVGKSNIISLICSLRDLINGGGDIIKTRFPDSSLTRWMKSSIQTIELCVNNDAHEFIYNIEIDHDIDNSDIRISSEKVACDGKVIYSMSQNQAILYNDNYEGRQALVDPKNSGLNYIIPDGKHRLLQSFKEEVNKILICTPNPKTMMDMIQNDVYGPTWDFSNIASAYTGIIQMAPEMYNELISKMQEIDSSLKRIRVTVEGFLKVLSFEYEFKDVLCSFKLSELSDGERMLFALYVLLYGYVKKGMTVLLDEPDNYISLREIQPWCIDLENIIGDDGQMIIISHHPEIIDFMAETKGIWFSRMASGETKLLSSMDIADNKDLLTYSQMISRGMLDEAE